MITRRGTVEPLAQLLDLICTHCDARRTRSAILANLRGTTGPGRLNNRAELPTGATPAVELALPGELALVDARSSDSPPYGTLLVRAPTGAVTAVTLRVEAGRATARRARFGTLARAVFTANQEVCARTDKELRCTNIVGAETTRPIAPVQGF